MSALPMQFDFGGGMVVPATPPGFTQVVTNVAGSVASSIAGSTAILLPPPLSSTARQQAVSNWVAERRYFRQLVGMADTLKAKIDAFPTPPPGDFGVHDLRAQLSDVYLDLTSMAARKQQFEAAMREAVDRLAAEGKLQANDVYENDLLDRPGLGVAPLVAIAGIIAAALVAVAVWQAWLDYKAKRPIVEQKAQALAAGVAAYERQLAAAVQSGSPLPAPPFDTSPTGSGALAASIGGIGLAAVGLAALFMLTRGGAR
ncbi:MAG: hypothetical protein KF768_13505 [Phycisphaeraceae bacterium]|nr:hypothetical protein [Phycisphaeraceae bacterium]